MRSSREGCENVWGLGTGGLLVALGGKECHNMLAVEKLQPCPEQWYAKVLAHDQRWAFRTCNKPNKAHTTSYTNPIL